jgi:hypothetical protein
VRPHGLQRPPPPHPPPPPAGLLSAFALSGDALYRERAAALGAKLLVAFDTKSGVPSSTVNLRRCVASPPYPLPLVKGDTVILTGNDCSDRNITV